MIKWLKKTFWVVVVWLKPKKPQPVIEVAAQQPTEQQPPAPAPHGNRNLRRRISALERARRKHDKFVTPQGTPPVPKHVERVPKTETEPTPPLVPSSEDDSAGDNLYDKHHEGGGDVLYKEAELYGEYNFRDTILEQLDRYFVYLKRMKKSAPDTYDLYRQVGSILIPYIGIHPDMATGRKWNALPKPHTEMPKLTPWFKKNRPGFGCFVYGANPLAEKGEMEKTEVKKDGRRLVIPKFMYFTKYSKPPPEVQPMSGGDVYSMSIWWDRPNDPTFKSKRGGPTEYAIFISDDGERLEILRMVKTHMIEVAKKKHKKDAHGNINLSFRIPQRCWQIPKTFREWADDFHEDVQVHLADLFVDAMKHYEYSQYSMVRIAAKKDGMTAVFSVNVRRMAYFFKDRDYVLNENGARKPVFHMVRAHERETVNGKHAVKFHFRGEREFTWAGHQISITVPGRDHFMMPELDIGSVDEYWIDKKENKQYLYGEQLGKKISNWIDTGIGGKRP